MREHELTAVEGNDMMIANLACCTPEHSVQQTAEMMVRHDCGEIAIVETVKNLKPTGVITDRDIAWRVVVTGKTERTRGCATHIEPAVTVTPGPFLWCGSVRIKRSETTDETT